MPRTIHTRAVNYGDGISYCTAFIRAVCAEEAREHYLAQLGGPHYSGPGRSFANSPFNDGWDSKRKAYRVTQRCGLDI
jgi:hypothetical protein